MAVTITSSSFYLIPTHPTPNVNPLKHPAHLLTSCSCLHINIFLPLPLYSTVFVVPVWLSSSVFSSLDLSELAKAAKKKLQAVSWVELLDFKSWLTVHLH